MRNFCFVFLRFSPSKITHMISVTIRYKKIKYHLEVLLLIISLSKRPLPFSRQKKMVYNSIGNSIKNIFLFYFVII